MSVTPQAACRAGSVAASAGSINANAGRFRSVFNPRLASAASSVRTAESLISLPAAGIVNTTPTGSDFSSFTLPIQMSQISASGFAVPCAVAFAVSMTLPPPTAKIRSAPNAIASRMASRASPSRGFGFTPPITANAIPAPVSRASTRSSVPLFFALCPP